MIVKKMTNKTSRNITLLVLLFFIACKPNKPEEINDLTNIKEFPTIAIEDLTTVITDSGKIKFRFITPEMLQFDKKENPTIEFPKGLHLVIYDKLEEIDGQIKSEIATYYENDELWELRKDVEAINTQGEVINTELLFWDMKKKKIYSDEFIKITTDTEIITGYGFESDEKMQNYKIKNISGVLSIEE